MREYWKFILIVLVFLAAYLMPLASSRFHSAIYEALVMVQEYAREHVLFCLVPAFFIAGAIAVFVSQAAVIKYFGAKAKKWLSYSVASVSGAILAVCSCTVLPLFAGIYKRGAGIGPATAFLYSGPAINVLAIILTARVLGWQLGLARAVGAVFFAVVIGLLMALIFRKEDRERSATGFDQDEETRQSPIQSLIYFLTLVLILIFAAWARPKEPAGLWWGVYRIHWYLVAALLVALGFELVRWFRKAELRQWVDSTWGFSKQILPLLFAGVLVAGFLMGMPGSDRGIIPSRYITTLVGGNSLLSNFTASVIGALMYFATLTEVPILQGLLGSGMGYGPALALLLAGPALSLPNMFVIRSVLGSKKTLVYILLVVIMATITGLIFGSMMEGGAKIWPG
ncbi:permease [candidate division TA06 bacterium]|uniref:Permease n=1 Tax=candidate division TA06 bacterium TaxID=2250710 RepID=A0A523UU03_UNCT6|nr:MAG: permease [candidate division TA06 bacterium]